jgi:FKBP-type peptidyl-prolyl cis-trans isomerase FkpA
MMKCRIFIFFVSSLVILIGCRRRYPEEKIVDKQANEKLLNVSRAVVHDEAKAINEFISRHGWKMQMTGTGLRYDIYQQGTGPKADASSVLSIAYKVNLLDGTLCYEADEQHPEKLVTGRGDQIIGLEEGLMMMNEGARARFVIPNHLAYGLTGDQDKIPPASALYYDVHLLKIEKPTNR